MTNEMRGGGAAVIDAELEELETVVSERDRLRARVERWREQAERAEHDRDAARAITVAVLRERDRLRAHYDAAGPEHNLLALLDNYIEEANERVLEAQELRARVAELEAALRVLHPERLDFDAHSDECLECRSSCSCDPELAPTPECHSCAHAVLERARIAARAALEARP